jgi:malonyl-CoA decarboxylase
LVKGKGVASPLSSSATANALTPSVSVPTTTETPTLGTEWRRLREKWTFLKRRPVARGKANELIATCQMLMSRRGDVSGARLAADVAEGYRSLDDSEREAFFDRLVTVFSPDLIAVKAAADAFTRDPSQKTLAQLQQVVESPMQELFRRWNMAPGGTAALISLRRRLLSTLDTHPSRRRIDDDLMHLFRSWFNRGFLVLQRIDWRTPAVVLERLIKYEAVHQIHGWDDLRRRLAADRRCYAFFHPVLPDDPLIFIEVALTSGMPGEVRPLLALETPVSDPARAADTATFYSITNCQEGLRGVSFGNVLIKQVVEDLSSEFNRLRTFATLSPITGFRTWLASRDSRWANVDPTTASASTKRELTVLCAQYLLQAKRDNEPADPVARFHLANGAALQRLNWMGDPSSAGLQRSFGLMANYVYRPDDLERNHEAYARTYQVVASRAIERLARDNG